MTAGQVITGIAGVSLSSGQSYFLEVSPASTDPNAMMPTDLVWFEETTTNSTNVYYESIPGSSWAQGDYPIGAYAVFGTPVGGSTTPEPGTVLLLLSGLAYAGARLTLRKTGLRSDYRP